MVTLVLGHDPETGIVEVLDEVVAADAAADFDVDITGANTLDHDFTELSESDLTNGELKFGLPAAMIVLILVFGALVAAFIPMSIAIMSIIVTVAISSVLGQFTSLSFFIVNMITAMGLALGIDYSLFVLSRYREERQAGRDKIDAIIATGGTSSKAVLFSGSSFVVALLGLLLVPDTILRSLALGAIIVGVVTMAAAITLLPALLSLLGDRVNALRLPIVGRDHPAESPFWTRAVGAVVRRPGAFLAAGVLVLLAAAFPVLGLHTGTAGVELAARRHASPRPAPSRSSGASRAPRPPTPPRWSSPATSPPATSTAAIARLEASVADDPDFGPVAAAGRRERPGRAHQHPAGRRPRPRPGPPRTRPAPHRPDPRRVRRDRHQRAGRRHHRGERRLLRRHQQVAADRARLRARAELHPAHARLPLRGRSPPPPWSSTCSRSARRTDCSCWSSSTASGPTCSGFQQVERVEAWVPVFLFSVLFALSMDYHVFLLSRIRERYAQTGDTNEAVVHGIAATGRIITGAALIIVVVFAGLRRRPAGDVPADGLRSRRRPARGRHPDPDGRRTRGDGRCSAAGTGTCPAG